MTLAIPQPQPPAATENAVSITVEMVTPALAAVWLDTNGLNRPLSTNAVRRYAAEMSAGRWLLDGAAIRFAHDGRLLDGQHRLRACLVADTPFQTVVMRGLDPHSFTVMDDGRKRRASDVLAIAGETHAAALAGALRYVVAYETGRLFVKGSRQTRQWTNQRAVETLRRHPGLRASTGVGSQCRALLPPSLAIGMHYLFSRKDAARADTFFASLADGLNLTAGDPVATLRQRLIEERARGAGLAYARTVELMVRAWNAARTGRTLSRLTLGDTTNLDIL